MVESRLHRLNRRIHLYAGLIMIPYIVIFGLSGLLFNHPTWFIDRSVQTVRLQDERSVQGLFPDLQQLAASITDSIVARGLMADPAIANVRYANTLILRNLNRTADYRAEIDVPRAKIQLMTLPDFAVNPEVARGNYGPGMNVAPANLLRVLEQMLVEQGIDPGDSRVQRIPDVIFDLTTTDAKYRVNVELGTGNYRVVDLNKRKFEINNFLTNIHQVHAYPLSGFSIKWLWVLFADALSLLMIVWAATGIVMWYRMKRVFTVGAILLTGSLIVAAVILSASVDLGY